MKRFVKLFASILLVGGVAVAGYLAAFHSGFLGTPPQRGEIEGKAVPAPIIANRMAGREAAAEALDVTDGKQILFGDLHVHTTYSTDAFLWSLPMAHGEGPHPIADACDFARYCSALDFWAIADHAEASTPRRWAETKDAIRQCQALSGDEENPDLVSFTGFEWTQVGVTPDQHFGHKNVIFKGLADDQISKRPIAASGLALTTLKENQAGFPPAIPLVTGKDASRYFDFNAFVKEVAEVPLCDQSKPSSALPASCTETAADPGELVNRLENQGLDPLIIPHGTTWGFYTPSSMTWNKALKTAMRPDRFKLIEIYSGHGNSEIYRDVQNTKRRLDTATGEYVGNECPAPSANFTPSCWRAGQIIEERCLKDGNTKNECTARAAKARVDFSNLGNAGHLTIPGAEVADWLDSNQCTDCFQPAFNYRFGGSVQAGLATRDFSETPEKPSQFTWGFIGSSDNHRARPGTGYKEYQRRANTEASGAIDPAWRERMLGKIEDPVAESKSISSSEILKNVGFHLLEFERQASFFTTGGLAAVHSKGRNREAIWDALQRRETFGTSGPRMLLWFDLISNNGTLKHPMGSEVNLSTLPTFRVKAVGALKQKPGLPEHALASGIGKERLQRMCGGEAYNPDTTRLAITRIEIIRIRPQTSPDEKLASLIDDPFLVKQCRGDRQGCTFEFSDPDYEMLGRDTLYYARAIQEATPTINGKNLRCDFNDEGVCIKVNPCYGDYRSGQDECLAMSEHRAWSSPIYLRQ